MRGWALERETTVYTQTHACTERERERGERVGNGERGGRKKVLNGDPHWFCIQSYNGYLVH